MITSENINELAGALAKAQGAMGGALKDSANPFFKSKYADLESVWSACRKALSDNGLAVIQTESATDSGVAITTMLAHSSGQWIRDTLSLQPKDMSPQGMGSAITYGRRYALASIAGVYQTDDDAEAAHGRHLQMHTDPRGEEYKKEDMKKAKEYAERFRDALVEGKEGTLIELHNECAPNHEFYIAVSTFLTAAERRSIKDAVRVQKNGAHA